MYSGTFGLGAGRGVVVSSRVMGSRAVVRWRMDCTGLDWHHSLFGRAKVLAIEDPLSHNQLTGKTRCARERVK